MGELVLLSMIRRYKKLSQELQSYLVNKPNDWHKYQQIFNTNIDEICKDITEFEKENLHKYKSKIDRLKKIFENDTDVIFYMGNS